MSIVFGLMNIINFAHDGTVADLFATELVIGGAHNWLEVFANNHRTTGRLNPVSLLDAYNPEAGRFRDVYVVEKIGRTREGWSHPAADEEWQQASPPRSRTSWTAAPAGGARSRVRRWADRVATLHAGYVSAERGGAEVPVPVRAHA